MTQSAINDINKTKNFLSTQIDEENCISYKIKTFANKGFYNLKATFIDKSNSFLLLSIALSRGKVFPLMKRSYKIVTLKEVKENIDDSITASYISSPAVFYSIEGTLTITQMTSSRIEGTFNFETKDMLGMTSVSIKNGKFSTQTNCKL